MALATIDQAAALALAILSAPVPGSPSPATRAEPVSGFNLASYPVRATPKPQRGKPRHYPSELADVPADDATPPPRILWTPMPAALVRIVPAKVRFNMNF
jgi:hypothetical protein